jgi:beta-alanine degradation protein BauB
MYLRLLILVFLFSSTFGANAGTNVTQRIPYFSNAKVNVWKTIIYPSNQHKLLMHRHEYDRVAVAFDDGEFKVVDNVGRTHFVKLTQGQAYYWKKDAPGELHTDENLSHHPVRVCVVELKS